jgi:hypothetical protein
MLALYLNHIVLKVRKSYIFLVNILKFLVMGKGIDYGGPIDPANFLMVSEKILLPSIEMIKDWEVKQKVIGGLFAAQRAGVIIIEAQSAEELSSLLQSLPFWAQNTWEVITLQTFQSGIEDVKKQIANVKKMIEMSPKPKYESAPI